MVWLQVQIIASTQGFLAFRIDIGTKVILIRRLVWRETRITIEAISTIFDLQMSNLGIKTYNTLQSLSNTTLELSPYNLIFRLVLLKPGTVIIGHHLAQELQYPLGIHSF
jgi:hypothetical protein